METFRKDLRERYFSIAEYFGISFSFFIDVILESKGIVTLLVLFSIIGLFFPNGVIPEILEGFFPLLVVIIFLQKKVVNKIEGVRDRIEIGWILKKIIIIAIYVLLFSAPLAFLGVLVLSIISFLPYADIIGTLALVLAVVLNFLYFNDFYYLRDFDVFEALAENFKLSKGNRLRKFIPMTIINILMWSIIILIIVADSYLLESLYAPIINMIFSILIVLIFIFGSLYLEILSAIIFLNVEYRENQKIY